VIPNRYAAIPVIPRLGSTSLFGIGLLDLCRPRDSARRPLLCANPCTPDRGASAVHDSPAMVPGVCASGRTPIVTCQPG